MKKAASFVLFVLLSLAFSITAVAIELVPIYPWKDIELSTINDTNVFVEPFGKTYFVLLDDEYYEDISFECNGIVSAELVDYNADTMHIKDDTITYKVCNKSTGEDIETNLSYYDAQKKKEKLKEEYPNSAFSIEPERYIYLIKIDVAENFTSSYKKGILIIYATEGDTGRRVSGKWEFISDVIVKIPENNNTLTKENTLLKSITIESEKINGVYVDTEFDKVIGTVTGAKSFSYSGKIPDGMKLTGSWAFNHKSDAYVLDVKLSGKPTTAGDYSFDVNYKSEDGTLVKKISYSVSIAKDAPFDFLHSIEVTKWPTKLDYYLGDTIDTTGMKVIAYAYEYDADEEAFVPFELDVTDMAWIDPASILSDNTEGMNINVYVSAPCDQQGNLKTFDDHFRVNVKRKEEYIETEKTDKYLELNLESDYGCSSFDAETWGVFRETEEKATAISTNLFYQIKGGTAVINGECFTITMPLVSSNQGGINFINEYSSSKNSVKLEFYSEEIVQSDFTIDWNLGINYYQLRELFGMKVEEDDVVTYYVLDENNNCVKEIKVDYNTIDLAEEVKLHIERQAGTQLGVYRIVVDGIPVDGTESFATVEISDENIVLGKTKTVTVSVTENSGAEMIQFALKYDTNALKVVSCKEGAIASGAVINCENEGIIYYLWDSDTALADGGTLLNVEFTTADGAEEQETEVYIDTAKKLVFADGDSKDKVVDIINGKVKIWDIIYGDVTGDGYVDVRDSHMIRRSVVKYITLTEEQRLAADVNGDGKVNTVDANYIRRYAVKLLSKFPVE